MNRSGKSLAFFSHPKYYLTSNAVIYLRKKIVEELLGDVFNKQIIDIGCGNAEITKHLLLKNRVTFLDFSDEMLELAKENTDIDYSSNSSFINSDFLNYYPDQKFDIVICLGVLAHVDDINSFLEKLYSITKDDGIILLQFTASEKIISKFNQLRNGLFSKTKHDYEYKTILTSSQFIGALLNKHGLRIVKKAKYLPVSPLFSLFNYKTKIRLLDFTYSHKLLSFLSSEKILLLSKN